MCMTSICIDYFLSVGVDMAHVTVGIPRLRELLMTGSVKQPVMQLPLRPEIPREMAEKVAFRLAEVPFRSLVASVRKVVLLPPFYFFQFSYFHLVVCYFVSLTLFLGLIFRRFLVMSDLWFHRARQEECIVLKFGFVSYQQSLFKMC